MTGHAAVRVMRQYLALRPVGVLNALRLYSCYFHASLVLALCRGRFRGAGRYLGGSALVTVRSASLTLKARPRSEDLLYLLPAHKATVWKWFHPLRGEFVADVGAHVGLFSLLAARAGAKVLSIEPNPATAEILAENVVINGFDGITCSVTRHLTG